jgi:hemerythrin-like domain-containing protein
MIDLKNINDRDPLKRQGEHGLDKLEGDELSPMNPPDAYEPPAGDTVPYDEMHPFLKRLIDEHVPFVKIIDEFEETLLEIQKEGINRQRHETLKNFFIFFDEEFGPHNRIEERLLFPVLNQALIDRGEHSKSIPIHTAVDMLEDEHNTAIQLAAVVFNFFALVSRLSDRNSQLLVLDAAIEQGKDLAELLKLHIFREDHIVFPLAHKYVDQPLLDEMLEKAVRKDGKGKSN